MKNRIPSAACLVAAVLTTVLFCLPISMSAQKKLFTLEDLNFGGKNFHNLRAENLFLTWWGDQLMQQDAEQGCTFSEKAVATPVFRLADVGSDWHSAMNARYPYADQPLVLLRNAKQRILYDFKKKQTVWHQTCEGEQEANWNKQSRAVAYVKDKQLYVRDADDKEYKLTDDGSREIVYGQAVHRNEFGIDGGLFWSADGQRLAFYRMNQSMVTDYPQVNIDPRIAELEPDKYPMAGMTSHQVTVGVYDLKTRQTVYLQAGDPTDRYFTNISF